MNEILDQGLLGAGIFILAGLMIVSSTFLTFILRRIWEHNRWEKVAGSHIETGVMIGYACVALGLLIGWVTFLIFVITQLLL